MRIKVQYLDGSMMSYDTDHHNSPTMFGAEVPALAGFSLRLGDLSDGLWLDSWCFDSGPHAARAYGDGTVLAAMPSRAASFQLVPPSGLADVAWVTADGDEVLVRATVAVEPGSGIGALDAEDAKAVSSLVNLRRLQTVARGLSHGDAVGGNAERDAAAATLGYTGWASGLEGLDRDVFDMRAGAPDEQAAARVAHRLGWDDWRVLWRASVAAQLAALRDAAEPEDEDDDRDIDDPGE